MRRRDADRRRRHRHPLRPQLRRPRVAGRLEPADRQGRQSTATSASTHSQPAALVVDINGVIRRSASARSPTSAPTRATDTSSGAPGPILVDGVPVWPPYEPLPALDGVAALTGLAGRRDRHRAADRWRSRSTTTAPARPQWGLEQADAVIEVNVEGITRFVALFHTDLPAAVGPVRSARTGDLDLLTAMNRPVFAILRRQPGCDPMDRLGRGLRSARRLQRPARAVLQPLARSTRPAQPAARLRPAPLSTAATAGPARPLWPIDPCVDTTERRHHRGRHDLHRADGRRPHRVDVGSPRAARTSVRRTVSRTSPCRGHGSRPPTSSRSRPATSRRLSTPAPRTRSRSAPGSPSCTATAWPSRRRGHAPPRTTRSRFHDRSDQPTDPARHRHDVHRTRTRLTASTVRIVTRSGVTSIFGRTCELSKRIFAGSQLGRPDRAPAAWSGQPTPRCPAHARPTPDTRAPPGFRTLNQRVKSPLLYR